MTPRERAYATAMLWFPDKEPDNMQVVALAGHIELAIERDRKEQIAISDIHASEQAQARIRELVETTVPQAAYDEAVKIANAAIDARDEARRMWNEEVNQNLRSKSRIAELEAALEEMVNVAREREGAWDGATEEEFAANHFGARVDEAGYIARTLTSIAATALRRAPAQPATATREDE